MTEQPQFSEAELARLADGSLPAPRRSDLRAQVSGSPELAAALAEQERAVSLLRALDEPAPAALRARIDELTASATVRRPRPRRRWTLAVSASVALAIAIVAVVIGATAGSVSPTLPQTVRLTLAAATMPAPAVDAADPSRLALSNGGIAFPNASGFHTTGARIDTVAGRRIATVFYVGPDRTRVGYAIVSGAPLPVSGGRSVNGYDGVRFTWKRQGATNIVTWQQSGHTCVIAGPSVGYRALRALARAAQPQV
ncbi:MAG: anti-sigma factor family protein [Solirubrobacteraceae bacterium]